MTNSMVDYKNVKLVVADMDGTLLHSDYTLNPEFFDVYRQLKEINVKFMVASGRQYDSLLHIFESIKDEIYFIAENGGNVIYREKQLFAQKMEREIINEVVKTVRALPDTEMLLCGVKNAYVETAHPEFEKYVTPYYPKRKVVSDLLQTVDDQIVKIAIYNKTDSEKNILPYVEHLKDKCLLKVSGKNWLDISEKNSNKGLALRKVQEILHISKEETMVFGDYLNDLEMMEEGYFSYAMANAHPFLKENARFQTSSNDNDGVLKVLKEVIKQRGEKQY
ncbi:MAG: Cof-type HAD-IIB family hydrolase [Flavobacteriaceae bacterium]|jgi:Cof subfamily protein (haloacid dehalogenase superfamily)|nr:Cof-type HAD-IIB family hydrolase [Flavobacteriaceae bacterium]